MTNAAFKGLQGAAGKAVDCVENTAPQGAGKDLRANWLQAIALQAGVTSSDIVANRRRDDLVLRLRGSMQTITITDYFRKNAAGDYVVEEVRCVDGKLLNLPAWRQAGVSEMALEK